MQMQMNYFIMAVEIETETGLVTISFISPGLETQDENEMC